MGKPGDLTGEQWQAVEHFSGPLLVLAGPGSGKTRVITRRIARLVERGVDPRNILAITFTNKAAKEMAERVSRLMPGSRVWVSTFHRFCASQLRRYAELVGLQSNFTILDQSDQTSFLKQVMSELEQDLGRFSPGLIASKIGRAKNRLLTPEDLRPAVEDNYGDPLEAATAKVYALYQKELLRANSVDFDDLLLHMAVLLREHEEIRERLDYRFEYVLVDEFQDTNIAQYEIVRAFSVLNPNLCATGDPDQSIYGWRGAEIENILRFERDFPGTQQVRLEMNFRSTQSILHAADHLIVHNTYRKHKQLLTNNGLGKPVQYWEFEDADAEAEGLARFMVEEVEAGRRAWSDFAILYRVNSLSRRLERACVRYRIPHQIASGVAFYERAEIKDLLAYLRLINNPHDIAAFRRIVNTPVRGIGKQTQNKIMRWSAVEGIDLLEACTQANRITGLGKKAMFSAQLFARMMSEFALSDTGSVEGLLRKVIEKTRYTYGWDNTHASEDDVHRLSNVNELIASAAAYDHSVDGESSLEGFLEESTLVADLDNLDPLSGKVSLLTLHSAKGLEFPVVMIVGLEQNLLPHERSLRENNRREVEEERRLLFVGITRAKSELILTRAFRRDLRGKPETSIPSMFLPELALGQSETPPVAGTPLSNTSSDEAIERHKLKLREQLAALTANKKPLLMTGASLMNGSKEAVAFPTNFAVGMRVRHPQQGYGQVTEMGTGIGSRRTVTVQFESGVSETYVAQKSALQPVGIG
ncbi:MAG: ATP-dependent helicase, Rep family [Planctomycetaceae bacterium]|nr:ATP-dependent helicase, Rep family [Planctomycetaceae bacterium]